MSNCSSLIAEFEAFGFNESYLIHLKNIDFNTTQLYYPLASDRYQEVIGSDALDYQNIDTVDVFEGIHIMVGKHPWTKSDCMIVCTNIDPFNHRLIISVPESAVYGLILERFKIGLVVYLLLLISSIFLYRYLRKNLRVSMSKVRTEQANLKSIFESTSNVIGLFDQKKQLLEFNNAFNDYSMVTNDLPLERNMDLLPQIKHQESAEVFSKFMDRALSGEKFQEVISYPCFEDELTFRFTYNPVYDEGQVVGFAFFAEDISEIRSYQK